MDAIVRASAGRGAISRLAVRHRTPRHVSGAVHGSVTVATFILTLLAVPAFSQSTRDSTQGYFNFSISTRTFDAPLFGDASRSTFRLFARQELRNGVILAAWGYGGFPSTTTLFGIEADRVPFRGGLVQVGAGDFSIRPIEPAGISTSIGDAFPLQGASVLFEGGRSRWSLYAGQSKYLIALPETEARRPLIGGGEYLLRSGRNFFGAGAMFVEEPAYAAGQEQPEQDAVFSGRFIREISPWANLFTEAYTTAESETGFRAGTNVRFQNGRISSAIYSFDGGFPFVPLVRPGEQGLEVSGNYRPSELSTLSGQLYYVTEDVVTDRSNLRGYAGFARTFAGGPTVHISYSRDELTFDALEGRTSRIADRAALSITRAFQSDYASLQVEHLMNAGGFEPDRTQAIASLQRALGTDSFFDATLVGQAEGSASYGFTAEAAYESYLRGPWRYLVGLGGAWVDRGAESGEGLVRLGITRRIGGDGVYGRVEARIPFDIGLPRSNLNRNTLALDIGTRYGWNDLRDIGDIFTPIVRPSLFGSIEGTVTLEGEGVGGLPILLDGRRVVTTSGDGSYRVRRVPVGLVAISISAASLEPGYSVDGEFAQTVQVLPRETVRADFVLARFSTFQGSLVYCSEGRMLPIGGARIALVSPDDVITISTSAAGGFQADDIPPGTYDVIIDPESVSGFVTVDQIPPIRLDLSGDVVAYVIRLGCPEE
ncbi:MAG TPA: carboxypeptidase-like regulatory domain-containing protein [Thermoanaerobaculia bacterium]|nr:carboxypeptidase-like regulatory domain-containing protein [Thermoanaerobaculia bacterium]